MEKQPRNRSAFWILATVVGCGGYWLYQNHLSNGFKQILIAACDEHASESDEDRYLHDAQAAAHTRKDRQVLAQFQHLVEINKDVSEYDRHLWDRLDADLTDVEPAIPTPLHHLLALRAQYIQRHSTVPQSLQEEIDQATRKQQEQTARRHQQENIDKERTDRERKEIDVLYKGIRTELGMPAVTNKEG